ncbi:MAG: DUF2924 domain-containing protein [Candidatus Gastranaerophilales bacterium]|nr:DUF2924 domain-containing protein [Candidatus Gastranaerophilales bacterium]
MKKQTVGQKLKAWHEKYDDLSPKTKRKLNKMIEQYEKTQNFKIMGEKAVKISTGVKLIREFKGKKHEVISTEKGFEYKGENYRSLSAIANKITGTRWNGKVFFGVNN